MDPDVDPTHLRSCRLTNVRVVGGPGDLVDVVVRNGLVTEVGPGVRAPGLDTHDGGGGWVIPGLWDAHVHLGQWVLMDTRLDTSAVDSPEEACALVADAVARTAPGDTVQGWGHRSALWPRRPTAADLDAVSGDHPVVLISGDAHHGWLNTRAMELLGVPARDGVVEEAEWFDLFPRLADLPGVTDAVERRYPEVVRRMNAAGVVGVVDMEFGVDGFRDWPRRFGGGRGVGPVDTLRVRPAIYPPGLDRVVAAGLRSGQRLPGGGGLLEMGPLKVIVDGSLNTRTAFCCDPFADAHGHADPCGVRNVDPDELTALMRRAHVDGLEVAAHAIGDRAVREVVDCFETSGARGAIEHAQLIRFEEAPRMAALGVRASVQPAHLWDDRDVSAVCWPDRVDRMFPLRTLRDAGVTVRLGSDAPVSPLDPWLAIAAAVHRSADDRAPIHPEQALTVAEALADSTDGVGHVRVGAPGDVVLLDRDPLAVPDDSREVAAAVREMRVLATIVAGRLVHG